MNHSIEAAGATAAHRVAGWVPPVARMGYAAKGVVYLLVGGIAVKAASAAGGVEGNTGALATLADSQGGRAALVLIAAGLLGHVVWRVVQALLDPEHDKTDAKRVGMRAFYALSAFVYGSLALTAWQLSKGSAVRGNGHEIWVARLLDKPMGTWLVMAAGLGVMAYGVHQVVKAIRGDVNRRLHPGDAQISRGVTLIGRLGTAARGIVMLPIGWFVFTAGRQYRAALAADTGEVLKMFDHGGLLAAVGIGLAAYGLHQIAKAVYRQIDRPSS